jgi:peptide methionine sulfoxide reductase msrA/msrB
MLFMKVILLALLLILMGCTVTQTTETKIIPNDASVAYFAGGCFWCMEPPFEQLEGVLDVKAGYAGGTEVNPTYDQVVTGSTSHAESIIVVYDPSIISYKTLVETFWQTHDPTDVNGSFYDRGHQYRSVSWYNSSEEKAIAEESKAEIDAAGTFDGPIVTEISPYVSFYEAEEYHQDYAKKAPLRYAGYKKGSGREDFIKNTFE